MRAANRSLECCEGKPLNLLLKRSDVHAARVAYVVVGGGTLQIKVARGSGIGFDVRAVVRQAELITLQCPQRCPDRSVDFHLRAVLAGCYHNPVTALAAGFRDHKLLAPHQRRCLLLHYVVAPRIARRNVDTRVSRKHCHEFVALYTRAREVIARVL